MAQAFVKVIKSPGLNNKNPMLSRLWPKTAVLTAIEQFILFLYCQGFASPDFSSGRLATETQVCP
jgi:hypothetical protein